MTITGSTSCEGIDHSPPPSSGEVPGSSPSQITSSAERKAPMANSGTEVVRMLATEMVRSRREPSRIPASTPNRTESGTMTAKATAASRLVLPSRSQITSLTCVL